MGRGTSSATLCCRGEYRWKQPLQPRQSSNLRCNRRLLHVPYRSWKMTLGSETPPGMLLKAYDVTTVARWLRSRGDRKRRALASSSPTINISEATILACRSLLSPQQVPATRHPDGRHRSAMRELQCDASRAHGQQADQPRRAAFACPRAQRDCQTNGARLRVTAATHARPRRCGLIRLHPRAR